MTAIAVDVRRRNGTLSMLARGQSADFGVGEVYLRGAENNRKAWEEAAQRSDETAPPLQTPSIQLTPPSESKRAQSLFAKKAAEAAQAGPGAIQRGIGAAGRAAETGGKLVERAAGKVGELADKYEGTLSAASAVAGASSGPLGALAGSQVPEAIRKAARSFRSSDPPSPWQWPTSRPPYSTPCHAQPGRGLGKPRTMPRPSLPPPWPSGPPCGRGPDSLRR